MSIDQYCDKDARRAYMRAYWRSWMAAHPGKRREYRKRHSQKLHQDARSVELSREEDEMRAILRGEE